MTTRPNAALIMWPGVDDLVITPPVRAALAQVVTLIDDAPIDLMSTPLAELEAVEVLIGSWGCAPLDAAALDRLPALRLLAYAAGTVKAVVTDELWARGVAVSSAAAANAVPVAEFTFAAIVMIAKDVIRVRDAYRANRGEGWVSGVGPAGPLGTHGLKVGVIGASKIGRLVLERLRTLDVELGLRDPYLDPEEVDELGATPMGLDELCGWADIVTVHAPELTATRHMIDAERLALMRDGAWLINTARGSIVDTAALEAECASGRLAAWIDTPDPEPLPPTSPLWDLPNAVLTPHIAGSMGNEAERMGLLAAGEVGRFLSGRPLNHEVRAGDEQRTVGQGLPRRLGTARLCGAEVRAPERAGAAAPPTPALVPGRRIVGYSAVLLPHTDGGEVDWVGFESLLGRTLDAGLIPAVNMDTGYVQLLTEPDRARVLATAASLAGPGGFAAGAFVPDTEGDAYDPAAYSRAAAQVAEAGGTPVVFPSWGLASLSEEVGLSPGVARRRAGPIHRVRTGRHVRALRPDLLP
jgi:phosphoglycerate dehydrogenase-like enzyme